LPSDIDVNLVIGRVGVAVGVLGMDTLGVGDPAVASRDQQGDVRVGVGGCYVGGRVLAGTGVAATDRQIWRVSQRHFGDGRHWLRSRR
jgi:hypothetical protein